MEKYNPKLTSIFWTTRKTTLNMQKKKNRTEILITIFLTTNTAWKLFLDMGLYMHESIIKSLSHISFSQQS